jgi:hypothetical protein
MIFSFFLVAAFRNANLENMEFVRAHNEWVGEVARPLILQSLPPVYERLTSPAFSVRRNAEHEIGSRGLAEFANLALASKHRDPNISMVATRLLENFYVCSVCRGAKECTYCSTQAEYEICKRCNVKRECRLCNGTGDSRYVITGNEWEYRKNLFPGR